MDYRSFEDPQVAAHRLSPPAPAVIWGALMMVALVAAGATVLTSRDDAAERVVAVNDEQELRRSVMALREEREALTERMAKLERGLGEMKLAERGRAADVTGSIDRGGAARGGYAVSLGADASIEAVRRRWGALVARYPQTLGKLGGRAVKEAGSSGVYDLVAGPFATRNDAQRACAALADQGFPCDTAEFAGEPLARP